MLQDIFIRALQKLLLTRGRHSTLSLHWTRFTETVVSVKEPAVNAPRTQIRALGAPGDLGWVVMAHGEIYATEFGWDTSFEALVARIVADYAAGRDPAREAAWIAEAGGRRVGCVFCVAGDDRTAKLRILLADPAARGHH